jgi:UDP-N-acetyl-2-amino-2-deoxyglucuronate dehydrogenase
MLTWIFGEVEENIVHIKQKKASSGFLKLKNANVRWFLSVNFDYLPNEVRQNGQTTYRSIMVNGDEIEFSGGFKDLHTRSYEKILEGNGFGLDDAYKSVEIISKIRKTEPIGLKNNYHPFAKLVV